MVFNLTRKPPEKPLSNFCEKALGSHYGATTRYLTKDGKPYICRMGEVHFSRLRESSWEEALLKMRNGGIDVIASYVFWLHHEEVEGEFDFSGNRNIKAFLALCKKLKLPFVLRLGPWVHGEAKNGGFPDWLIEKTNGVTRTDAEPYMTYVRNFFEKLYAEIKDYSDVILGIQIENELRGQRSYAKKLKEMLVEIGYNAPYWTFTGWGGSDKAESCPVGEVLCLYSGYPEAPWFQHTEVINDNYAFLFMEERDDCNVGADLFKNEAHGEIPRKARVESEGTPYLTCELGGGNQITYHRRPIISTEDVRAIAITKLGSGANGIGYYVYHGGINPVGKTTTMQESRQSGYPNDLPIISYDFQAPLGEAGQVRQSYFALKRIHEFIELCGERLAPMPAYFPDVTPTDFTDTKALRCAVRSDGESGFLFINNHFHKGKTEQINETVTVHLKDGKRIDIPITAAPMAQGIIPFGFPIGTERVEWISAMPIAMDKDTLYLSRISGIAPRLSLTDKSPVDITDGMIIGGIRLVFSEEETVKANSEKLLPLSDAKNSNDDSFYGHIVNYDGTCPEFGTVYEYSFTVPKGAKYLRINALGNISALYEDGVMIADQYLYGRDWVVDVRDLKANTSLVLKVLTLTERDKEKIYFEFDMPTGRMEPTVSAIFDTTAYVKE